MIATSERSIPRLITISPMPRPRMPRIEMLRKRLSRLFTVAKPFSVRPKAINSAIVIRRTICSWLGLARPKRKRGVLAGASGESTATTRLQVILQEILQENLYGEQRQVGIGEQGCGRAHRIPPWFFGWLNFPRDRVGGQTSNDVAGAAGARMPSRPAAAVRPDTTPGR